MKKNTIRRETPSETDISLSASDASGNFEKIADQCARASEAGEPFHNVSVSGLQVRPSAPDRMSINVDATHFISCPGEVRVEDSHFEGCGDDAANVHGINFAPVERIAADTVRIDGMDVPQSGLPEEIPVGDRLRWVDRDTLLDAGVAEVAEVRAVPGNEKKLREVRFTTPLPEGALESFLLTHADRFPTFVFRGNRVFNLRGRGAIMKTRGIRVEDNHFEHCTSQALHLSAAVGWRESGGTSDVAVRDNQFRHCGIGHGRYARACAFVTDGQCRKPDPRLHTDILFENNRIESDADRAGLILDSASNVTVRGNTFADCGESLRLKVFESIAFEDNRFEQTEIPDESAISGGPLTP